VTVAEGVVEGGGARSARPVGSFCMVVDFEDERSLVAISELTSRRGRRIVNSFMCVETFGTKIQRTPLDRYSRSGLLFHYRYRTVSHPIA
jgi:hypothetical protein